MYEEDVAGEIVTCMDQVDCEFGTQFEQFTLVGREIDIKTNDGQWFTATVAKRIK